MAALTLQLTTAGLAAVTAAAGTSQTVIAELGLTATAFVAAPTLTALPGEFKRLDILSGVAAAPNVAHVTAYDESADVWTATGFGLFLEDGTLFATYSANEPVLSKVGLAFALMAFDISFNANLAADISFGNATFVWPPATESTRGIAQLATQPEVDAGVDDQKIVTPKKLWQRLQSVIQSVSDEVSARVSAVTTLWAGIANEATARTNGDNALGGRITGEEQARAAADLVLNNAIGAEAQARFGAVNALTDLLSTEAVDRAAADIALGNRIDGEAGARTAADTALGNRIDGEAGARAGADAALSDALAAEAGMRNDQDTALQGQINTLAGRQVTGEGLVSGGGNMGADRTLTVTEASPADITAGEAGNVVVTPRRLGPITMLLEQNGFIRFFGFQIA